MPPYQLTKFFNQKKGKEFSFPFSEKINFVRLTYEKVLAIFRDSSIIEVSKAKEKPKMKSVKKFFNIESPYKFEWNDLRCFITVINVVLIMTYGLSISWFGLAVAIVGIVKDLTKDRRINGLLMHLANVALNIYFLWILYR
jgi:hypothetical protein